MNIVNIKTKVNYKSKFHVARENAFLRNDDVRGSLDESLVYLTESVIKAGFPITHAVEPANVTTKVTDWLLRIKETEPEYVEIIQHGFDHRIKTKAPYRGEFGGGRGFDSQLDDISKGKELMEKYFGDRWTKIFSFPYGTYDPQTLRALEACDFKTISTGVRFTSKRKLLNRVGHLLGIGRLFGHNIVYFNQKRPMYSICEFPIMINFTKRQIGADAGIQKNLNEMRSTWDSVPRNIKTRGILCHHRFCTKEDIDKLLEFLIELKERGIRFSSIGRLYEKMDYL